MNGVDFCYRRERWNPDRGYTTTMPKNTWNLGEKVKKLSRMSPSPQKSIHSKSDFFGKLNFIERRFAMKKWCVVYNICGISCKSK
jgi:hypothetical protein